MDIPNFCHIDDAIAAHEAAPRGKRWEFYVDVPVIAYASFTTEAADESNIDTAKKKAMMKAETVAQKRGLRIVSSRSFVRCHIYTQGQEIVRLECIMEAVY